MPIDPPSSAMRAAANAIRVMIVDDSAVVRGLVTRILAEDPDIVVVASVSNGQMALNTLEKNDVDVTLLDIEMPVMDGMEALPKLLKIDPDLRVIMQSTLTVKGGEISMRALEMGAADYIPKPTSTREIVGGMDFKTELLTKVRALGTAKRRLPPRRPRQIATVSHAAPIAPLPKAAHSAGPISLRTHAPEPPDIIAIGSSTGGPQALFTLLGTMKAGTVRQPIVITQHMPATFTAILGEHISRVSGWNAREAVDGEPLEGGRVYIAPGDFHMIIENKGAGKIVRLNKNPPENFCRPSVDPMLRSIAAIYGRRVLVTILTGMGADGLKGGTEVVNGGGTVIAQDEATSVVWGMPGAVATAGICSAVLPLPDLAPWMIKLASRR